MTLLDASDHPLDPARLTGRRLPAWLHDLSEAAAFFVADAPLVEAVNVALAVGAPLLLTGEPGTGKTQVAYWLCRRFGHGCTDAFQ